MTQAQADALIKQWELANEWLEQLEGREMQDCFDLMLDAAIKLGSAGYRLTPENHWYYYPKDYANEQE